MSHSKQRKLSESRGIKLPSIKMKGPVRSYSTNSGIEPPFVLDECSPITQVMKSVALTPVQHSPYQSFNLLPNSSNSSEPALEVLDIRIFFPDGKSVQFTVEGGKEAQATDLLSLIAKHFEIPEEIIKEVFALWLVSPLFDVQLKPHHVAAQVRYKWPSFLKKFTDAPEDDIALDDPLLVLRRNVSLNIDTERMVGFLLFQRRFFIVPFQYQKDYERIVEMLYLDARDHYLCGRYMVSVEDALELAALQMAIDYDPYEQEQEAFNLVR